MEITNGKAKSLKWVSNQIPNGLGDSNEEKMLKCIKAYCDQGANEIIRLEKINAELQEISANYYNEAKGLRRSILPRARDAIEYQLIIIEVCLKRAKEEGDAKKEYYFKGQKALLKELFNFNDEGEFVDYNDEGIETILEGIQFKTP